MNFFFSNYQRIFLFFIILIGTTQNIVYGGNCCCDRDFDVLQGLVYHTEGKGIGYQRGYTTLEFLFVDPTWDCESIYPFIDLRGHGFNNRTWAGNFGSGFRYLSESKNWIFGSNIYFDIRQGTHKNFDEVGHSFQQIGIGFEAISPCWEFRLNIYQPIGKKKSNVHQTVFPNHDGDINTEIIVTKHQHPMKGVDAEAGFWLLNGTLGCCCVNWKTFFGAGPYYLVPYRHKTKRFGGKARLATYINRYFLFEVLGSYDHKTRGKVQIRLGVDLPLYPCPSRKRGNCCLTDCSCDYFTLRELISSPVIRAEIIPLREGNKLCQCPSDCFPHPCCPCSQP